jgi:hypothetical protein
LALALHFPDEGFEGVELGLALTGALLDWAETADGLLADTAGAEECAPAPDADCAMLEPPGGFTLCEPDGFDAETKGAEGSTPTPDADAEADAKMGTELDACPPVHWAL